VNEDKGTRHRRLQRRLHVLQAASVALSLVALALAAGVLPSAGPSPVDDLAMLVVVGGVLVVVSAPWAWARDVALDRRFGRPVASTGGWARRHLSQWALTLASATPIWLLFQWLQRTAPWAVVPVTGVAAVLGSLLLLGMAPWLVTWSPRVTPLADEALAGRLHALVGRAGLRLAGVHAWREAAVVSEPNAALLGAGPGRRLLLSASLLESFAPEEIEVVVAHELGHHARGHIWRRIRLTWGVACGALVAGQVVALLRATLTGHALADPRALPLVLLAGGAVALAARPRLLAQSRAHEAEADDFALAVTGRPDVLERILTRLGAHYKAAPDPSPFEAAFFLTHPPVRERVTRVRAWRAEGLARSGAIE
jgi:STE24 endopeptidase